MTELILWLQQFSSPATDSFFLLISALTSEFVYLAVLGVVYWCIDKKKAYYISVFLFMSFGINSLLKSIFRIPRPYTYSAVRQIDLDTGYGYSFPSGHAQLSTTFSGMFSVVFKKTWIYIAGVILIILTGLSRMYLGVHTIADILCGIVIGLMITYLGNNLKTAEKAKLLGIASFLLLLGTSLVFKSEDTLKLLFFAAGFYSGNFIEEKYIRYVIPSKKKVCIIGTIVGFIITILINVILKQIGLIFIRYLILGLFITVAVPYFIKKMSKDGR